MTKYLFIVLLVMITASIFPQASLQEEFRTKGEVYFRFQIINKDAVNSLSSVISIDKLTRDSVYAYANEKEFSRFSALGYLYKILPHPGDVPNIRMSDNAKSALTWDSYPTYDAYVAIMNNFQTNYPNLCHIYDAGTTVNGRKILFAKITSNVSAPEQDEKPEFMYSSTMHGNEATGSVLMLRLIDSLLSTYGKDPRITNLLDNVQIWINPLANPDGTYHAGNSTVSGATRYNANGVDLNRNFPNQKSGPHPDGNSWQPETIAMMNLFAAHRFVLSANLHDGNELVNYPWDTWKVLHPDDAWFRTISRAFADTIHKYSPAGYFTGPEGTDSANGVTNGYDWYSITGGRQDYMTYYMHGREVTIELCTLYTAPASLLPAYWNYTKASFLNYIENTYYGIRGTINSTMGPHIKATITITGHDINNSEVISDSVTGFFVRMIAPGTYTVVISADSFFSQTFHNVQVTAGTATTLNAQLLPYNARLCSPIHLSAGWNLVSLPEQATGLTPANLFPLATAPVYTYNSGYSIATTLKSGTGYWVKYPLPADIQSCGTTTDGTLQLSAGWNLIGISGGDIPVSSITTLPAGIIVSPFYTYNNGYSVATTLVPTLGYWVKASGAGTMVFSK